PALEPGGGDRFLPGEPGLCQRDLLGGAGAHAGEQGTLHRAGGLLGAAHATRGAWERRPSPTCQIVTPLRPAGSVARSAIVTSTWPRSRRSDSDRSERSASSSEKTSSSRTMGVA